MIYATIADLPTLLVLEQTSFGEESFNKRQLRRLILSNTSDIIVYKKNNNIIGSITVLHRANSTKDRIYNLVVSSEFRGNGIAQQLISEVERIAKINKKTALTLEVREDNISAINLYQKLGFIQKKRLISYYQDKSSAIYMIKML